MRTRRVAAPPRAPMDQKTSNEIAGPMAGSHDDACSGDSPVRGRSGHDRPGARGGNCGLAYAPGNRADACNGDNPDHGRSDYDNAGSRGGNSAVHDHHGNCHILPDAYSGGSRALHQTSAGTPRNARCNRPVLSERGYRFEGLAPKVPLMTHWRL